MTKAYRRLTVLSAVSIMILILSSCGGEKSVTIAEQYGLAYAPLQIMRTQGYFEILEADVEIRWVKLGNTAAIREAMLSGEVDLGFMGLPPFLIGADRGMDWKLVAGLSICPVGLVAGDSIPDFGSLSTEHRIALPQPGSIQHILLSMAAEREYGDAARFDQSLVTMKHPDGMTALLSGAVDAHFTSPPYIFMETEADSTGSSDFHVILSGEHAFGGTFSFIGAAAGGEFIREEPELLKSFLKALRQSVDFINNRPAEAAGILAEIYELPEAEILRYLVHEEMKYTTDLYGLDEFISFMTGHGYLSGDLDSGDVLY